MTPSGAGARTPAGPHSRTLPSAGGVGSFADRASVLAGYRASAGFGGAVSAGGGVVLAGYRASAGFGGAVSAGGGDRASAGVGDRAAYGFGGRGDLVEVAGRLGAITEGGEVDA
jgi:hypothetical protein